MNLHASNDVVVQCHTAITVKTKQKIDGKEKEIEEFVPCTNIQEDNTCKVYLWPAAKWNQHDCPFSHKKPITEETKKINPLKASKRRSRGK